MNEANKSHPIQSPTTLLPSINSTQPPLGAQVSVMSTHNSGNYTTMISNQTPMKQVAQSQPNHIPNSNNGTSMPNQNAAPGQQFQPVQQMYRQAHPQMFATQQQQPRQVIVHQQPSNMPGQPTMISQIIPSPTDHNMSSGNNPHSHSRYQPQMMPARQPQPMTSIAQQDYRNRADSQPMNMQAHPQTLQRSQSYQSTMNPSGTVLQVQQIAQPPNAQPHMQPTHTIVVSQQQQQLQMPVQSMNQQMQPMHQQQHSKQFMTVNQGIVAVGQPPQPQMQQVPGGQGMPHQIQHSISNQNQSFQIQRIGGSPRPTGSAGTPAGQQQGKPAPTQTHLAAALTNPPANRPEMIQSTSTTLPQTMHFVQTNTSNYSVPNVSQQITTHPVQIRVQPMPVSGPLNAPSQPFDQAMTFSTTNQLPVFAVPFQRAPLAAGQMKTNGPLAGVPANNLMAKEATPNAKERYRQIKRRFKYLVYENECYQDELRNLQRKLLKLSRDKNFLLDRLQQHERLSDSSDESDSSIKTIEDKAAKSKKKPSSSRKKPPASAPAKKTNVNTAKSTQTKAKVEILNLPSTSAAIKLESSITDSNPHNDSIKAYVQTAPSLPISIESSIVKRESISSPTSQMPSSQNFSNETNSVAPLVNNNSMALETPVVNTEPTS